ncbi:hypothetical protein [Arthrobacter sp. OY3WO11]|uniref:hypothetical protein n=1 Tax=Arthrobacter sp. OY3WO11 TaxID=1835723 RepID=UPI000A675FDD|nr:hypothetical protein [Arthrobacter sp. OY3WO11]
MAVDSAGRVLDFGAVRFLHPEDHVFTQMLTGWRNQQLSRNLAFGTIEGRERLVTRFQESTNEYPWQWTPAHVDEFFGDLRSIKHGRAVHHPELPGSAEGLLRIRSVA